MNVDTITAAWIELEEARWTPERERIAQIGINAREEALIAGAPPRDAAWLGVEAIDRAIEAEIKARFPAPLDRP